MITIHAGFYNISDTSLTHNQLLLRCCLGEINYDLLFEGVIKINMPFRFSISSVFIERTEDELVVRFVLLSGETIIGEIWGEKLKAQKNDLTAMETSIPSEMEYHLFKGDLELMLSLIEKREFVIHDDWQQLYPPDN